MVPVTGHVSYMANIYQQTLVVNAVLSTVSFCVKEAFGVLFLLFHSISFFLFIFHKPAP